jgi:hypothetical protein
MPRRLGRRFLAATATLVVWGAMSSIGAVARAQQVQLNPGLTQMLRYFSLDVVSGRIVAASPQRDRKLESQSTGKDRRERLSITLSGEATSISYELAVGDVQVGFEVVDGAEVTVSRRGKGAGDGSFLEFHQPKSGRVSLRVGEGDKEKVYQAGNLWQLLAAEPVLCREKLTPLLQLLKPDWRLDQIALDAERSLYESAKLLQNADLAQWRQLIDDLGDPKFSKRQAADRRLRAFGRGAALFLMSIDWRRLDAEQQARLRAIYHELSGGDRADTPDRVAFFLARDPRVWLRLLETGEAAERRLAHEQLERLLSIRIAFDPEGDPPLRETQLAALRRQLDSIDVEHEASER